MIIELWADELKDFVEVEYDAKPCPVCGSNNLVAITNQGETDIILWWISCSVWEKSKDPTYTPMNVGGCGAESVAGLSVKDAVNLWNNRMMEEA